jgi:type I restriction enzyme S subunit
MRHEAAVPHGWTQVTLGDLADYHNGRAFKKSEWRKAGRPIIRIQNLTDPTKSFNYFQGDVEPRHEVRAGDVLVSWAATLGVFRWDGPDAVLNQHIFKVVPKPGISPQFLYYLLQSIIGDLRSQAHGSGMVHITKGRFLSTPVFLPPLAQQVRIVEAVESVMAAVDEGERSLDAARSRALALAESAFEAAVDVQAEKRPLRELLREPLRNGHSAKAAQDGRGVRTLTLTAVTKREFIDAHTKITAADKQRVRDLWLEPGDILVQRSNTPELVGTAARYNGPRKWAIFPDLLIRVRTKDELLPEFLECFLRAPSTRRLIRGQAQGIAGSMPKISQGVIEGLRVPLPSVRRQEEIVSAIFDRVHAVDQSVRAITDAEADARRLRRALLHAAFSGRLVPQDPADEPASELLKRIEAEKAEREAELKAARRRTRKDRSGSSAETAEALPRPPSQSGKVRTSSD